MSGSGDNNIVRGGPGVGRDAGGDLSINPCEIQYIRANSWREISLCPKMDEERITCSHKLVDISVDMSQI